MAVTGWDDYFIHQVVDTIDAVGSDEATFQERYIFCCHNTEGTLHLIAGLGTYPNVNVMDAFVCIRYKDVQRNIRVSRHLQADRTNTEVGPLSFKMLEPLKRWGIYLGENDYGIGCSLEFDGRAAPYFWPFSQLMGGSDPKTRSLAHYDQPGRYTGSITFEGQQFKADGFLGTRDHSWGPRRRRPPDSLPTAMGFVLWPQLHFSNFSLCFCCGDRGEGGRWCAGAILGDDGSVIPIVETIGHRIEFVPGSRSYTKVEMLLKDANGKERHLIAKSISSECHMSGGGYDGRHGLDKGPFHVEGERWDVSQPVGIDSPYGTPNGIWYERDVEIQLDGETGVGLIESIFDKDEAWQYKPRW